MDWRRYLGLPHTLAADPDEGRGADCLILVFRVLDSLGIAHPALDPAWFTLAAEGRWPDLEIIFDRLVTPAPPEDGAITLLRNGPAGLGLAVVIEGGLLMVHHRRGVVWAPLHLFRPLPFFRFHG